MCISRVPSTHRSTKLGVTVGSYFVAVGGRQRGVLFGHQRAGAGDLALS